jgi:hypothetical protein
MGALARTIAQIVLLPSVLVAVAGYVLMVQSLNRVAPEEGCAMRYPWATRATVWIYMLGGFGDEASAAVGEDKREWNRAALGRAMVVFGFAAFFGGLIMWKMGQSG